MAAIGLSPICYNHPEKKADFKCFDCKRDSIINLCPQCNIQVHSLDVFRAHRVEPIEVKNRERRLSQDVSDIEKLIAVESDILQNVLTRLQYCEEEEKETISHLIQLQTATKKRIAEIKECTSRVEKAFSYLTKVSTLLTQCSGPVVHSDTSEASKDPVSEATVPQLKGSVQVQDAPQHPQHPQPLLCAPPAQEPAGESQNGPPEEPIIKLPNEIQGKDIFPVSVVGSLARNGSFWMIKIGESDLEKQRQIQSGIRAFYQIHGFGSSVETNVGTLCAALNRRNKEFGRVRIEGVANTGMVKIRFVDLGFVEDIQPSCLCQLPKEFVDIPFQALECCLLPNLDTQLPYEAKWCFKDLTFNKFLMAALEGQVTDKKGHVVNHVILALCSEVPVCINTKVAMLVEEQKLASEDRPVQPKAEIVEDDAAAGGEVNHETPTLQVDIPCDHAPETAPKADTKSVPSEEKEKQLLNTDVKISVTDVPVLPAPSDNDDVALDSPPTLRADAAEFVPVSPENSLKKKILLNLSLEQSNVPGILHLPVMEDKTVSVKPVEESCETLPDTQLPDGCVDFVTYNHITLQCSMNVIPRDVLPKAKFVMIRSNWKRTVEAMKCGLWCSTHENNKRLNRTFNEQENKGGSPVFLLFSGPRSFNFCGMAQMLSAVDPNISCPASVKLPQLASKMVGSCIIKWIYAQDLFFADVLTPECGFHRWFLANCGDVVEIPNKLGQLIVEGYDSCTYFRSILKRALESYQTHMLEQKEGMQSAMEPSMSYQSEEQSDGFPMSQEEDWDQEIEELNAAKSSETESLVESPAERKEPSPCVVSEADIPTSTEATSLPGIVQSFESSNGSDSAAVSSVPEGDFKVVNVQRVDVQDALHVQESEHQRLSSASLSTEMSNNSGTSEVQDTPKFTVSSIQDVQVEESVDEDGAIVIDNESDWESASTPRSGGKKAVSIITESESTEFDSTVTELRGDDKNIPTDAWEKQLHSNDLQSGNTVDASRTEYESVVHISVVPPCHDWAVENTADEQTTLEQKPSEVTSQEDLSKVKIKENVDKLTVCIPQENSGEPGASDLLEVVASGDNPGCGGGPLDSHSDDYVLVSDDGSKVTVTGAESSYVPRDEAKPQEVNGESESQHEPQACSDTSSQSSLPARADLVSYGSSENLLSDYDDLPVEIGKEHYIYAQENLSSTGTFWARVHRTAEEEKCFVDAMERMGARIEAKNEPLEDIFMYKHCAVRGLDNYWYRALVEKTSVKGKVGIRLLDLGEYWEVHQKRLRVLDNDLYAAPPAQAFECTVSYENPSSKKEKNRISRLVKWDKKLHVIVKNYSEGTVGVQILS